MIIADGARVMRGKLAMSPMLSGDFRCVSVCMALTNTRRRSTDDNSIVLAISQRGIRF